MRRARERVKTLDGHLLFAEVELEVLVLDCLLGKPESALARVPVTLKARLPRRARRGVLEVLESWTDDRTSVEVSLSDTARGTQVEISSWSRRIVLQP